MLLAGRPFVPSPGGGDFAMRYSSSPAGEEAWEVRAIRRGKEKFSKTLAKAIYIIVYLRYII